MKTPFQVHPALTPIHATTVQRPRAFALSDDGKLCAVAEAGGVLLIDVAEPSAPPRVLLPKHDQYVEGLAFAPAAASLAVLTTRFEAPRSNYGVLEVFSVKDGAPVLTKVELGTWGSVGHGTLGGKSPYALWSADGRSVYVRSAEMTDDQPKNSIVVVEVATGKVTRHVLPAAPGYLFSFAWSRDAASHSKTQERLLLQFSSCGEGCGLWSVDPATFAIDKRSDWAAGEVVVVGANAVWSVGHREWVWRTRFDDDSLPDQRALTAGWERGRKEAEARRKELLSRAKAAWDKSALEHHKPSASNDRLNFNVKNGVRVAPVPEAEPGVRALRLPEVFPAGGAAAAGEDDVVCCDGSSVYVLRDRGDHVERTRVVDDLQCAHAQKGRMHALHGAGGVLVLDWTKARYADQHTLSFFRCDVAALDAPAAPAAKKKKKKEASTTKKAAKKTAAKKKPAKKKTR